MKSQSGKAYRTAVYGEYYAKVKLVTSVSPREQVQLIREAIKDYNRTSKEM